MRRTTSRKQAEIRQANLQRILDAAEVVFSRRGLQGATIDEIAAGAGLPKANILYYFRSKQHLYRAVIDNIRRYRAGQDLIGLVDRMRGY